MKHQYGILEHAAPYLFQKLLQLNICCPTISHSCILFKIVLLQTPDIFLVSVDVYFHLNTNLLWSEANKIENLPRMEPNKGFSKDSWRLRSP